MPTTYSPVQDTENVKEKGDLRKSISIRYSDQTDPKGEKINVFGCLTNEEENTLCSIINKMANNGIKLMIPYREF